jgi:hypothetical protein
MIGFIAGAGIIVRNSIIRVDFIELKLKEDLPMESAAVVMAGSSAMLAEQAPGPRRPCVAVPGAPVRCGTPQRLGNMLMKNLGLWPARGGCDTSHGPDPSHHFGTAGLWDVCLSQPP